ncbi:MAG: S1/P1 nuclease [Pseudomonadota bacterium]
MKKLACVMALSCAFLSTEALAWGPDGHRAVGSIAEKLIKGSNAEKQVAALLLPGESLESITNWADGAKGGAGYAPATPEQVAYTALNPRHVEYHYANVPFQLEHYHDGVVGGNDIDIVQTLKQAIAVLQGKTDPALNPRNFSRRQALLLIAHLSGDIHQPLHMGSAYVGADGKFAVPAKQTDIDGVNIFETRGGNSLLFDDDKVEALSKPLIPGESKPLPEGAVKWKTRPLHTYWDSTVVDYAMRRSSTKTPDQFAQKMVDGKPVVAANTGDATTWPYQWADDALVAAKQAYTDVTPGKRDSQPNKRGVVEHKFALEMGPNYPVPSSALARTQLVKGGYHLAALLQSIWP